MSIQQSATISVNLSNIPKDEIFTADSGDKFITLDVVQKDEVETHTFDDGNTKESQGFVSVYKPKDRREEDTVYVGDVKWVRQVGNSQPQSDSDPIGSEADVGELDEDGALPF